MKSLLIVIIGFLVITPSYGQKLKSDSELKLVFPATVREIGISGEIEGMMIKMGNVSFSSATAKYINSKMEISVVVLDYYGSNKEFINNTFNEVEMDTNYSSEDAFGKRFEIDGKKGYMLGDKESNSTILIMTWDERYMLNISVKGKMNEAYIKSIYKEIDLSSL